MTGRLAFFRGILALLMITVFGAVILPWQAALQNEAHHAHFRSSPLDLGLREQIGQSGFLAALSGFRSLLAAFLWIDAHSAWEKTEWGRMAALFNTVTTLQPHTLLYWDIAAWHMAWNASAAALQDTKQKSEILRERARRQYIELGRDILDRGIRNNPDQYLLHDRMGILLRDKLEDHAGASEAFAKAATFKDAPAYIRRFAAYELAKVPGCEQEAYERLLALYNEGEHQRLPSLVALLQGLERKLDIPQAKRIAPGASPSSSGSVGTAPR